MERLQRANGKYEGFASKESNQKVPVQLLIQTTKNPNSGVDQPVVQATLRIGLFAGVELISSKTSYDWKTNELIAVFTKGKESTENSLELRASIDNGKWQKGTLTGARSGSLDLTMEGGPDYQMRTYKDNKEFTYKLTYGDTNKVPGVSILQLKRQENSAHLDNVQMVESDLPYFPSIRASFVFKGLEESPEVATAAIYDPLRASLQIFLESGAQIIVSNLFAADLDALSLLEQSPQDLRGSVIVGSSERTTVKLERMDPSQIKTFHRPTRFAGTYQGSPNAPISRSLVYLDYMGTQRSNSNDQIFKVFPYMRLKLLSCMEPRFSKMFDTYAVDHLQSVIKFSLVSDQTETAEFSPGENWETLNGRILNSPTHGGGGTVVPVIKMNRVDSGLENGCDYFN